MDEAFFTQGAAEKEALDITWVVDLQRKQDLVTNIRIMINLRGMFVT